MCAGRQQKDLGAALFVADDVELGIPSAFGDAYTLSQGLLFCASGSAEALCTGAIDEQPGGHTFHTGKSSKDTLPDAALGPAPEPVVERLLRLVDRLRAAAPAAAALQGMNDARERPSIIDPWHPACITLKKPLNPRPLLIRKPKESAIQHASLLEVGESYPDDAVNPVYGSGP